MDIIYGEGHSYGLYWLEQQGSGESRHWIRHTIDQSYSQIHALKMVDLDSDGQPELLTGKRYRGHSGRDPDPTIRWSSTTTKSTVRQRRSPATLYPSTAPPVQERSSLRKTSTGMAILTSPPRERAAFICSRI